MEEKDYKKLYEDVVALAKDGLKDGLYLSQSAKAVTEFLFPQLKETEDEKVRKELTTFLINFNNGAYSRPSEDKIDSWIKWIDKKCKQNPEPKFKAGDWITNGACIIKITSVDDRYYWHDNDCVGGDIESIDKEYHLWTIQDAKDGDVLAEHETIVLFKKIEGQNIRCYCTYHYLGFNTTFYVGTFQNKNPYCPATKEQRDLLFQKMKEAGYEWDDEKKELKRIEKKPAWSEEDEDALDIAIRIIQNGGDDCAGILDSNKALRWLKSIKDRVQLQPKQEWSEEDEKMCQETIDWFEKKCFPYALESENPARESIKWLKSLKGNVQPQLKQVWSEEDNYVYNEILKRIADKKLYEHDLEYIYTWLQSLKEKIHPNNE